MVSSTVLVFSYFYLSGLEEIGYQMAVYPLTLWAASMQAIKLALDHIKIDTRQDVGPQALPSWQGQLGCFCSFLLMIFLGTESHWVSNISQ